MQPSKPAISSSLTHHWVFKSFLTNWSGTALYAQSQRRTKSVPCCTRRRIPARGTRMRSERGNIADYFFFDFAGLRGTSQYGLLHLGHTSGGLAFSRLGSQS